MADTILGNLVWKITGEKSGFDKSIIAAEKSIEKFGKRATEVGKTLTIGATLPIIGIGTAAVLTAAKIETQRVAFGKLLQDTEKGTKLFEELKRFSAETPLQLEDITKGAQRLLAFGVSAEEVQGKLRRLGDAALGNSATLDRLTNAYGKLRAKGKATLEELNLFTEAGVPILDQLAKGYGKSTSEVLKFISEGKVGFEEVDEALTALTDTGGQFSGVMEAIAETTEGKLSTAIDNVKLAAAEFGAILLPTIKEVLDEIIDLAKFFQGLDENTKELVIDIAKFIAVAGPTILVIGKLTTAVRAFNLTALAGPGGIIALVGLAAGALVTLVSKLKESSEETVDWGDTVSEVYKKQSKALGEYRRGISDQIQAEQRVRENFIDFLDLSKKKQAAIREDVKLIGLERAFTIKNINSGRFQLLLDNKRLEIKNKLSGAEERFLKRGEDTNKSTKKNNDTNKEAIETLGEWEKQLISLSAEQLEANGKFVDAAEKRIELINDEEKLTIQALEQEKKKASNKEKIEEEITNAKKFFAKERSKINEEAVDKEKEQEEERKEFLINSAKEVYNATTALVNAFYDHKTDKLEEERIKALEEAGVAEETELERTEKALELAKESGDELAIAEAETALKRARINEDFEKKRRKIEYDGALASWGFTLAETTARGVLATQTALATPPAPNLFLAGVAGSAAALNVAAVGLSKPRKPSYAVGIYDIPQTTDATIHEGESILTKPITQSIKKGEITLGGPKGNNGMMYQLNLTVQAEGRTSHYTRMYKDGENGILVLPKTVIVEDD